MWCRSFQNARTMAAEGAAGALLRLLLRADCSSTAVEAALCSAMRHVAVNDDICKVIFAELGSRAMHFYSPHDCILCIS